MNLFGIDFSHTSSTGFSLANANQPAAKEPDIEKAAPETTRTSMKTNMMAGSFVHAEREDSRYISGLKTGLALQNSFMDKMNSVLAGYRYLVELSGDPSYSKEAVDAVNTMVEDEVKETNTEKLEDIREDIEEKAEEAMAPESEKVLKDDTSAQEALEESLDAVDPSAPEQTTAAPTADPAAQTADPAAQSADPAAQPADAARETTPEAEAVTEPAPQTTPLPSIDLMV